MLLGPMNNDCTVHRRILQSIYVFLTKNDMCPRYGTHWEEVGFQASCFSDPPNPSIPSIVSRWIWNILFSFLIYY